MPISFVSPGVYTREQDFSLYAQFLSTTIVAMVGTASRGPFDKIVKVTSFPDYVNNFGPVDPDHLSTYAAQQFFNQGNQLIYVRVGGPSMQFATGSLVSGSTTSVYVSGSTIGTYGNDLSLVISAGTKAATKKLMVRYQGYGVETFDNLVKTVTSDDFYEERINGHSRYIQVINNAAFATQPTDGTYNLVGGNDGVTDVTDGDYIGATTPAGSSGMQVLNNSEVVDFNLLAVPGVASASVIVSGITLCESRADALFVPDPPLGLTVQDVTDWHNGLGGFSDHAAFNSSYGALYWPWLKIYDAMTDTYIWIPPSTFALESMAFTDHNYDPWFAPAGLTRGRITAALTTEYTEQGRYLTVGDRNYMYSGGNAVNPIVNFPSQGIVIWGQRTLQRTPTALDRVNVRRMLLAVRKIVASSVRALVFEPNDKTTWQQFINLVTPILRDVKSRRGLVDFRVVCDETTNTEDLIENNQMSGKLFLKPTKTAEIIVIDFILTNQGASFNDNAAPIG